MCRRAAKTLSGDGRQPWDAKQQVATKHAPCRERAALTKANGISCSISLLSVSSLSLVLLLRWDRVWMYKKSSDVVWCFFCWKWPIFSSRVTGIRCYLKTLCLIDRNTERELRGAVRDCYSLRKSGLCDFLWSLAVKSQVQAVQAAIKTRRLLPLPSVTHLHDVKALVSNALACWNS